jgi:hypothetical protein
MCGYSTAQASRSGRAICDSLDVIVVDHIEKPAED